MVDTSLETIRNIFFNQIKNLSRRVYLDWQEYKQGIELLDNLHVHSTIVRLEIYR